MVSSGHKLMNGCNKQISIFSKCEGNKTAHYKQVIKKKDKQKF